MTQFLSTQRRPRAFTLVELLVVIAIIGVLVSLLLPAVNSAREAARRTQCINQVRQIALAAIMHENTQGYFPTGGWGKEWTADPNRGFGKKQPGGWAFSVLPYMEEQPTYDLANGKTFNSPEYRLAMTQLHETSMQGFHCPSRRQPAPTAHGWRSVYNASHLIQLAGVAKSDYAANGGDGRWSAGDPPFNIPRTYTQADDSSFDWTKVLPGPDPRDPFAIYANGISFYRSQVKIRNVKDGLSKTYLVGEKHVDPNEYNGFDGNDFGENQSMFTGFEWDNTRLTRFQNEGDRYEPTADTRGRLGHFAFGSAHAGGFNMALCDGAVAHIPYSVDRETHRRLGSRTDGLPTGIDQL